MQQTIQAVCLYGEWDIKETNMDWKSVRRPMEYEEVKSVADSLKIVLPNDYCKKIGKINGGALLSAVCYVPNIGYVPYSRNLSLSATARGNAIVLYEDMKEKCLFPFGSVGNGDYFCFDLKTQKVVLYLHEKNGIVPVCKTFTEFIKRLEER